MISCYFICFSCTLSCPSKPPTIWVSFGNWRTLLCRTFHNVHRWPPFPWPSKNPCLAPGKERNLLWEACMPIYMKLCDLRKINQLMDLLWVTILTYIFSYFRYIIWLFGYSNWCWVLCMLNQRIVIGYCENKFSYEYVREKMVMRQRHHYSAICWHLMTVCGTSMISP